MTINPIRFGIGNRTIQIIRGNTSMDLRFILNGGVIDFSRL